MKKTTWLPALLIALFTAGSVLAISAPFHRGQVTPEDRAGCRVKTSRCPGKDNGAEVLHESLSRQLLHISGLIN